MFMCVELMLNAVNLTLLAFARHFDQVDGQIFVFFVMTVAAAEAAVGLAIIVALARRTDSVDIDQADLKAIFLLYIQLIHIHLN